MLNSPVRLAVLAQVFGGLIAFSLIYLAYRPALHMPLIAALVQGPCAAFVAYRLAMPRWWWLINFCFMPLVVLLLAISVAWGIDPRWYLGVFVLLFLVFWRTDRSRVPLYLSNATTAEAVAGLLPPGPCRVLDVGCGDGRLLRHLASERPDCEFVGVEHAPATWLWARLASIGRSNLSIRYGDFWKMNFGEFDVVYAFLSPVPMPALWQKCQSEMAAASLLISNSFFVPGIEAVKVVAVSDRRETQLYLYRPQE